MASILNRIWSQADFWDKKENQQQRQQFAQQAPPQPQQGWSVGRVVHDVTHNPVTNAVGNVVQNDVVRPVQRQVIKPIFNSPTHTDVGDFVRELPNATVKVFSPLARSAVGTGQAFSGLYDLATPGTGTNRVSKALDTEAKLLDQSAKQLHVNPVYYHGGQAVGDAAQFLTGAGEAKLAAKTLSELPRVGRVVRPIASVAPKINARVVHATEDLLNSGVKGRIAAKTIRGAANPNLLAGNIGTQAFYTGQQASRGQDINPVQLAATTAAFQLGAPLAGAVGTEVARPVIQGAKNTAQLAKDLGLKRPTKLNDAELTASEKVLAARAGYLNPMELTPEDGRLFFEAQKKLGAQPGTPGGIMAVDRALGAHRTFDKQLQQRQQALREANQRVQQFAQDHPIGLSTRAVNDAGEPVSALTGKSIGKIKKGDSAVKAEKPSVAPKVMTEEQYLASKGAGFMNGSEPALHHNAIPTKFGQANAAKNVMSAMDVNNSKRALLRKEYQQKIASGELRPPTREETLIASANGLPDLESTKAAQRLLQKRGIDWRQPSVAPEVQPKMPLVTEANRGTKTQSLGPKTAPDQARLSKGTLSSLPNESHRQDLNKGHIRSFDANNTTIKGYLPAPTRPEPKLLQAGTLKLTPAQAKNRFKAINNRGGNFAVDNAQKGQRTFTVSPKGTAREGANANGIKVNIRGSKDGVPVKVTPFEKPQIDFTKWKDKSALGLGRETMERNLDRVAGKDAPAVKKLLVESSRKNEAARTKFANDLRNNTHDYVVKKLGIKPGSPASASVQQLGEKLVTKEQIIKDVGEARAEQIFKAADYFRKQYDTLIDDWNIVRKKYGFDLIPKRKDYFRHFQAIEQNASILGTIKNAKDLPTEISGITDIFNPSKPFSDAALQRKGNKTMFDAVGGFDNYINSVSRQIFHTDTVQKGRMIEDSIRKAAADNPKLELPNFVANLHEWTNMVSGKKTRIDRAAEGLVGRKIYAVAEKIKQKTGANMIGANIGSAMTNFVPFTQAASTTAKTALARGMREAAMTPLTKNPNIINGVESSFLTRRYPVESIGRTKLQTASEVASLPFKIVDEFTSRSIVAGKYYENLSKGMNKQAAMSAADDYAARVITDRSTGQLPNLINTKTIGAIAQFQAEVNNQVSFLIRDIPRFANGNKAKIASSLTQFVLYSYLLNEGYQKVMGRRVQIDPLDAALKTLNPKNSSTQKTNAFKQDILGGLPFTSIFTGGRLPVNAMFPDVASIGKGVSDLGKDKNKAARELYKGVSGPLFYGAPPFGGGQAKKTIEDLMSQSKGYSETPTGRVRFPMTNNPADKVRGALFGQYATSQGQKYIQRTPKTLSDKQSSNLKALPQDKRQPYYDTIKKLNDAKVTATQKNIDKVLTGTKPTDLKTQPNAASTKAIDISPKIDAHSQHILREYDNLDAATRDKKVHSETDYEYKVALAKYENDKANGKLTDAENIKRSKSLAKAKVGKVYPKDVRDLYSLSKTDLYNYLTTAEKGKDKQKMAKQLEAYDTALYDAGLISSRKFKTGIAPAKKGGSRKGSSGSSTDKAAAAKLKFDLVRKPLQIVGSIAPPKLPAAPKFGQTGLKQVYKKKGVQTRPTVQFKKPA